jgi:hypothetical protein
MVPSVVDSDVSSRTIPFSTPIVIWFTIIIIVICFTIPRKEAVNSKQIQRDERSNNLTTSIINKQHNKEKQVFRPGLPNPWLQFIESSRRRQLVFALYQVSWRRLRRQSRPLSKKILTGWLLFEFRLVHLTNNFSIRPPIAPKSMGHPWHM